MQNIQGEPRWPIHSEAIGWVNRLIIDLKLQLMGHEPRAPITCERLNEWDKLRQDVERCRRPLEIYRHSTVRPAEGHQRKGLASHTQPVGVSEQEEAWNRSP